MEKAQSYRPLGQPGFVRRLIRTSAFRYTITFFILFIATFTVIGLLVFVSTIDATMKRVDRSLQAELAYLAEINARHGSDGWAAINEMTAQVARYKVVRRDGLYHVAMVPPYRVLTADVELPTNALTSKGMFEFTYSARKVNQLTGRIEATPQPAAGRVGNYLYRGFDGRPVKVLVMVARDISEVAEMKQTAQSIAVKTMIVTPFLALAIGAIFSTIILRRVDRIGQTVRAIRDGDLTRRIALAGTDDEFDHLSDNINAMLDQIERLMTGMRQVSDNIAHDLRSPLTRIRARLDAAIVDRDADLEAVLDQTSAEVERLLATFNALLSITRIEAGEGGGAHTAVDIAAVAEEMLELYEPAGDDEGVTVQSRIAPVPVVMGSRELISQAIANLLDNAFKYARHAAGDDVSPMVRLTVAPAEDGGVRLVIADNGPGVPEAERERIFQRFVRLEHERSSTGNGLGLSLVSAIVRRHGAIVKVGDGISWSKDGHANAHRKGHGLEIAITFPPPPVRKEQKP